MSYDYNLTRDWDKIEAQHDFEQERDNHEWQRCYLDCIEADDYEQHPAIVSEYNEHFESFVGTADLNTFDDWVANQDPADIIRWVGESYTRSKTLTGDK
jgi:hypothetical protein